MSIYTSEKVLPYVYLCTHKESGKFYIGFRCANKEPSHLDFPKYRTSSKIVKPNFHEYDWVILAEFFDKQDAYDFEQELIKENWTNKNLINLAIGGYNVTFSTSCNIGTIVVKDKFGNIFRTSVHDELYIAGDYVSVNLNKVRNQKFKSNLSNRMKGKVLVKSLDGETMMVSQDDYRYLNGELIPINKGNPLSLEHKKKLSLSKIGNKNPQYGKPKTKEEKEYLSNYYNDKIHPRKNKKHSNTTKQIMSIKKTIFYDLIDPHGITYLNMSLSDIKFLFPELQVPSLYQKFRKGLGSHKGWTLIRNNPFLILH